jgi:broad specificity phosphatase PhoE
MLIQSCARPRVGRIIFVRHGQAEHNLEGGAILQEDNPNRKPDNLSELTPLGRAQACAAGSRIRTLLGDEAIVSVVVSPFERTQQTLYCMQQTLGQVRVRRVDVDPRVREQEFGNFQVAEDMQRHREYSSEVGRFYYRRPTGESGADVYDRASSFWESFFSGAGRLRPQDALCPQAESATRVSTTSRLERRGPSPPTLVALMTWP